MDLRSTQLKDTYGNLVTTGTTAGAPTTGGLQNGQGTLLTSVGIGTNSPTEILQVFEGGNTAEKSYTSTNAGAIITSYQSDAGSPYTKTTDIVAGSDGTVPSEIRMLTRASGSASITEAMRLYSGGDISFRDGSANEAFYWDASTARLGIGTTDPDAKLDVFGSQVLQVTSSVGTSLLFNNNAVNQFASDKNYHLIDFNTSSQSSETTGGYVRIKAGQEVLGNDNRSYLSFWTAPNGGTVSEKMRIDSSGRVGIGTDSPAEPFDLQMDSVSGLKIGTNADGGATLTTYQGSNNSNVRQFEINCQNFEVNTGSPTGTSTSNALLIDSSGNVGIGETSPSGLLHLKGDTNTNGAEIFLQVSNNNTIDNLGAIHFGNNVDETLSTILSGTSGANNSSYLTFSTSATGTLDEAMRIDSSGNVLVGKDASGISNNGAELRNGSSNHAITATSDSEIPILVNRKTNDGDIIKFYKDGSTVGSIGTLLGNLTIGSDDVALRFHPAINAIQAFNVTTQAINDNAIDIGASTARFKNLYLGGSVYLGGTASANALDDYEEGTWTPVYAPQTGSFATMTMDIVSATYTKIGRQVTVNAFFRTDDVDVTGGSGDLRIGGLPFTVGSYSAVSVGYVRSWGTAPDGGYANPTTTNIGLQKSSGSANSSVSDLTTGATANQNQIVITATYFV